MRSVHLVVFGLLGAAVGQAPTDVLSYGKPADVGLSSEALHQAAGVMRAAVAKDEIRGCVLLVAKDHKIVFHEAYGWRDLKKQKEMQKDTLFRMASNSKAVTATAILQLVDRGKLQLDDPVHRYFPSFNHGPTAKITVRHLLTHTAELGSVLFFQPLKKGTTLQREVARFGVRGITSEPGKRYRYSNVGYNTLAGLIEVVGRQGYKAALKTGIYEPLGMRDSCNHETDADYARMSGVFRGGGTGKLRTSWRPGGPATVPIPRGSGGMISTAYDYAVFCQMFLNGGTYGGKRILSAAIAKAATAPQAKFIPAAKRYGFGWVTKNGRFSHTGSDGTASYADPKHNLIVLVFTQSPGAGNPRQAYFDAVLRACEK